MAVFLGANAERNECIADGLASYHDSRTGIAAFSRWTIFGGLPRLPQTPPLTTRGHWDMRG